MKNTFAAVGLLALVPAFSALAQDAEDPFADAVETRHGLMLQMATDVGTIGAMLKGETAYDQAAASKAAANVVAIASVISMAQFPEGSEYGKSEDSFALAALWANQDDFLSKVADLNSAAAALGGATADAATMGPALQAMGAACSACHKAYRQPEE